MQLLEGNNVKKRLIYRLLTFILMGIYIDVLQKFHLSLYVIILGAIPIIIFIYIWKMYIDN